MVAPSIPPALGLPGTSRSEKTFFKIIYETSFFIPVFNDFIISRRCLGVAASAAEDANNYFVDTNANLNFRTKSYPYSQTDNLLYQ